MSWVGRNEVWWAPSAPSPSADATAASQERLLVRDSIKLDGECPITPAQTAVHELKDTMHGLGIVGTLILRGPLVHDLGTFFLEEFAALPRIGARDWRGEGAAIASDKDAREAWRDARLHLEGEEKVLWSAARVRGCVVVKFGAARVEGGRLWIGDMLMREGSIARAFGDQCLMCVR